MPGRTLPSFSPAEIKKHKSAESCFVTRGSKVYDVTSFVDSHPGGGDLILEYAGEDITEIMGDLISHEHSEAAYEILDEYHVGFVASGQNGCANGGPRKALANQSNTKNNNNNNSGDDAPVYAATGMSKAEDLSVETDPAKDYKTHKFLDLGAPLFPQLWFGGFTKEFYLEQVHRPRHYKGGDSAPLFGNFLEPLSKTAWWVVPSVWFPCVAYGTVIGFLGLQNWVVGCAYWLTGLFLWTLAEYGLHRCLFHIDK